MIRQLGRDLFLQDVFHGQGTNHYTTAGEGRVKELGNRNPAPRPCSGRPELCRRAEREATATARSLRSLRSVGMTLFRQGYRGQAERAGGGALADKPPVAPGARPGPLSPFGLWRAGPTGVQHQTGTPRGSNGKQGPIPMRNVECGTRNERRNGVTARPLRSGRGDKGGANGKRHVTHGRTRPAGDFPLFARWPRMATALCSQGSRARVAHCRAGCVIIR